MNEEGEILKKANDFWSKQNITEEKKFENFCTALQNIAEKRKSEELNIIDKRLLDILNIRGLD